MKPFIILIFGLIFFSACNYRNNEITKVEFATGGCFGSCPLTATSVDSSLHYKYYSGGIIPVWGNKPPKDDYNGYYTGTISRGLWDSIIIKLNGIHYKQLDTVYNHSVDDESFELIVHYRNGIKHIHAQSFSLPNNAREVFYWIANCYKSIKLKQIQDTLKFETTIQHPFNARDFVQMPKGFRIKPPPTK